MPRKAKFQFSGGVGGEGGRVPKLNILKVLRNGSIAIFEGRGKTENSQSAKKWLKFNFQRGGLGCQTENTQSAKKWLNFNFSCQN